MPGTNKLLKEDVPPRWEARWCGAQSSEEISRKQRRADFGTCSLYLGKSIPIEGCDRRLWERTMDGKFLVASFFQDFYQMDHSSLSCGCDLKEDNSTYWLLLQLRNFEELKSRNVWYE